MTSIAEQLNKRPDLTKYKKKLMPFVQIVKKEVSVHGIKAFNLTLDFEEKDVLGMYNKYLVSTLDVSLM